MGKAAVQSLFYSILVIATLLLAGITILASYSGNYVPQDSLYMPIIGLAVPVLLIINLLVAIGWGVAGKFWTLIPLIAIGFNWNYLTAVIQFNGAKERPIKETATDSISNGYLGIATYNVHSFGMEITGYSCKEIARYMKEKNIDVLCFQEFQDNQYFTQDSIRKVFSHWKYASIPRDSLHDILPIAIFSRYPIINEEFISYPQSSNCSMQCDITVGTDTIRILNNHLQTTSVSQNRNKWQRELTGNNTRSEVNAIKGAAETLHDNFVKRASQTDSICNRIDKSPHAILVCGDFNSIPSSYTYRQISNRLKDGFRTSGKGYMYTFRYFKRLLRIDYIFYSPDFEGLRYYSPKLDLCSDHNPVLMDLKIN